MEWWGDRAGESGTGSAACGMSRSGAKTSPTPEQKALRGFGCTRGSPRGEVTTRGARVHTRRALRGARNFPGDVGNAEGSKRGRGPSAFFSEAPFPPLRPATHHSGFTRCAIPRTVPSRETRRERSGLLASACCAALVGAADGGDPRGQVHGGRHAGGFACRGGDRLRLPMRAARRRWKAPSAAWCAPGSSRPKHLRQRGSRKEKPRPPSSFWRDGRRPRLQALARTRRAAFPGVGKAALRIRRAVRARSRPLRPPASGTAAAGWPPAPLHARSSAERDTGCGRSRRRSEPPAGCCGWLRTRLPRGPTRC